jgi:parallel beta-helix repeat protein
MPLAVLLALPFTAAAQVTCGDVIGKGQKITLTADVGPCDGPSGSTAALVVEGGSLDLGGHTVTCADSDLDGDVPQGIVLFGAKSKVSNGTVVGCMNGFAFGGTGKHRVSGCTARDSVQDGFDLIEDAVKCRLTDVTATDSGNDGFHVQSDKNTLTNAVATGNDQDGIDLTGSADRNKVRDSEGSGNGDDGIEIGGQKNKVKDSVANDNVEDGFDFADEKNKLSGGSAQGNGGFDVNDCTGNKISKVTYETASPDCP